MQVTYKFRLYPRKEDEKKLLSVLVICWLLYNSFLAIWNDSKKIPSRYKLQAMLPKMKEEKEGLKKVNSKTLQMVLFMLSYKAESAGKIMGDVNPRGISKEYKYGTELDMDYNASLNILERGMAGQGLPFVPSEVEPLRKLIPISASSIVEVGSPLR